jgi:hypothetical protein
VEDIEATSWRNSNTNDLWVFDKLIVARKLGYTCGPAGVDVPQPTLYITRPCVNIPGMSRGARFRFLRKKTHHLPTGHFWCEIFSGRHLSVDYKNGKQILAVEGFRDSGPLWQFCKWERVSDELPLPEIFKELVDRYEYINIEYIGGKVIEIHFRQNPDFKYGNTVAYPVWPKYNIHDFYPNVDFTKLQFVEDREYKRIGFYIDM